MYLKKSTLLALTLSLSLSACSFLEPMVYRIDVAQGNYVEQKAVDQLRIQMTKEQVRYVLGSPMLIENGYPDTWHYIYLYTEGHDDPVQKTLTVHFDPNTQRLIKAEGDFELNPNFNTPLI